MMVKDQDQRSCMTAFSMFSAVKTYKPALYVIIVVSVQYVGQIMMKFRNHSAFFLKEGQFILSVIVNLMLLKTLFQIASLIYADSRNQRIYSLCFQAD